MTMKFIDKLKDLVTDEEEVVETKEIELEKEEKEEEHKLPTFMRNKIEQEEKREEDNVIIMNYLNQDKNERGAVYICQNDGNLVLFEYDDLNTKINKETTKLESFSGTQYCSNEVDRLYPYLDGYNFTVQDSIDYANQELGKFFPDYDLDLDITWVTIVPNTRPCYNCTLRQKIDVI